MSTPYKISTMYCAATGHNMRGYKTFSCSQKFMEKDFCRQVNINVCNLYLTCQEPYKN